MKLRHQGLALVLIPLFFECVFVALLNTSATSLERALTRQLAAQKVITAASDLQHCIMDSVSMIVAKQALGASRTSDIDSITRAIKKKENVLLNLISDDPQSKEDMQKFALAEDHLLELVGEIEGAYDKASGKLFFAHFLESQDYWRQFSEQISATTYSVESIVRRANIVVNEATPQAARNRAQLRDIVFYGLVFNIAAVTGLAMFLGQATMKRFIKLRSNMSAFAAGKGEYQPLLGADEIAEIDENFRVIAEQRDRAHNVRQLLMQMTTHDLRTPLSSISYSMDMLTSGDFGPLPDSVQSTIENMSAELNRLIALTNGLLDLESIEKGTLQLRFDDVPVSSLILQATNSMKAIASTCEIDLHPSAPDSTLTCDEHRVLQVLVNLIGNALKFAPFGSRIAISAASDNDAMLFQVQDQGPGIPAVLQANLFDPFVQGPGQRGGAGLGLYICRAIVERHGGSLGVRSEPGQGATFWFSIPCRPNSD